MISPDLAHFIERTIRAIPPIIAHRLLAQYEPTLNHFRVRPMNVAVIQRSLRSLAHDSFYRFPTPKARHDFLDAALRHLSPLRDHEELLVAFGKRQGLSRHAGSRLEGIWRGVGSRDHVDFTPAAQSIIDKYISTVRRGEVIVVHNHPPNDIKGLITLLAGWKPIPSTLDRKTALHYTLDALLNQLAGRSDTILRWYLVDAERLSEFFMPSLSQIVGVLGGARNV